MNELLKRKYYSLSEAAEQLGVAIGDLHYHLREGNIYYFLPGRLFSSVTPIPYEDLPTKTVNQINHLARHPDLFKGTFVDVPDTILRQYRFTQHEFFWVPHRDLSEFLITADATPIYKAFRLSLPDGMPVGFFNEYSILEAVPIGTLSDSGFPAEAVITAEEIERCSETFLANDSAVEVLEATKDKLAEFVAPDGTDDAGRKIAEYANRYLEENGTEPTASDLWSYLKQNAVACGMEHKEYNDRWYLQGRPIKERGLKSRLKKYRNPTELET